MNTTYLNDFVLAAIWLFRALLLAYLTMYVVVVVLTWASAWGWP